MTFKIDAKCGMRGFYTFKNAQGIVVSRPAQIVAAWSAELANILVALDGTNDTGVNDGPLFRWETSRHVVEYKTIDSFSYKNEIAPIPALVPPVPKVEVPPADLPSIPTPPVTVPAVDGNSTPTPEQTVDALMSPGATVSTSSN